MRCPSALFPIGLALAATFGVTATAAPAPTGAVAESAASMPAATAPTSGPQQPTPASASGSLTSGSAAASPASVSTAMAPAPAATSPVSDSAAARRGAGVPGDPASGAPAAFTAAIASHHPLIVVTFANTPSQFLGRAGTTAHHYAGTGYSLSQHAHALAERLAATYTLHEVDSWPIKALSVHCVVYEIPDNRPAEAVLRQLASDPRVSLAQPLNLFHTLTAREPAAITAGTSGASIASANVPTAHVADASQDPAAVRYNDPLFDLQTNLASLDIARAHERSQGAGVRIGLIDTAVDSAHPDLRGRIVSTRSFVGDAGSAGSDRHGTAMAGLMVAAANNHTGIVGIAPLARVEVFEACWQLRPNADEAACNTFTLAQAIAAALDERVAVVNLSIAGPADPLLSALVATGLKRGIIFVGASAAAPDAFPTGIPGVIAVGSNEHEVGSPTVTAPAVHVLTLHPDAQYDFESGTSVAAAEVSGVVALLLSADSHLTIDAVRRLLKRTAPAQALPTGLPMPASAGTGSPVNSVNANVALGGLDLERTRRITASLGR